MSVSESRNRAQFSHPDPAVGRAPTPSRGCEDAASPRRLCAICYYKSAVFDRDRRRGAALYRHQRRRRRYAAPEERAATIVKPPHETEFGWRQFAATDPNGYVLWSAEQLDTDRTENSGHYKRTYYRHRTGQPGRQVIERRRPRTASGEHYAETTFDGRGQDRPPPTAATRARLKFDRTNGRV